MLNRLSYLLLALSAYASLSASVSTDAAEVYNHRNESYGQYLVRADEFYQQRGFEHALQNYLFALEIEPALENSFTFNYKVGVCFDRSGRSIVSLPYFRRAASDERMGDYARYQLGQILSAFPDSIESAVHAYRALLTETPKSVYSVESAIALGKLMIDHGKPGEGLPYLDWALGMASEDDNQRNLIQSQVLLLKARAYVGLGQLKSALQTLKTLQSQFAFASEAYDAKLLYAALKREIGDPLTVDELIQGNNVLIFHGRHQEALNELAEIRHLHVDKKAQADIEFSIARIYMAKAMYQAAIPRLRDLWENHRMSAALLEMAKAARYSGDLDLAVWSHRTYLSSVSPSLAWRVYLSFEIGNSYSAKGDTASLRSANRWYSEVRTKGGPKSQYEASAAFQIAFNFYRLAMYDSAIVRFRQAAAASKWAQTRNEFWLAKALQRNGKTSEAGQIFARLSLQKFTDYYGMLSEIRHTRPQPEGERIFRTDLKLRTNAQPGYLADMFKPQHLTAVALSNSDPDLISDIWEKAWLSRSLAGPHTAARELKPILETSLQSYEKATQLRNFFEAINAFDDAVDFAVTMKKKYRTRMKNDPSTEWLFYPRYYEPLVVRYADWFGLDEALVFSLIKNESAFRTYSVSSAQAIGLMQIMPFTGQALASELRLDGFQITDLQNPAISIQMGTYYLHQQANRYRGFAPAVLGAYNAGPHRADYWSRNFSSEDPEEMPEIVELFETNRYIKKILLDRWIYAHRMEES